MIRQTIIGHHMNGGNPHDKDTVGVWVANLGDVAVYGFRRIGG
jgi:hypothetical protein